MLRRILLLVLLAGCGGEEHRVDDAETIRDVGLEEAAELFKDAGVGVLDLRTPREFQEGHIPHALNIDFLNSDFAKRLRELDRDRPYLIHCASGNRSTRALPLFGELGFKKVYHLKTGIRGWIGAGYPIAR